MSIIIFNPMNDIHCRHMINILREKNIEYQELGSPEHNDYAIMNNQLLYNGEPIKHIRSVYFRSILSHHPNELDLKSKSDQYISQIQFSTQVESIRSWLSILNSSGIRVINPPTNNSKYVQLYTLHHLGIPLPKTCITSSPYIARQFISEVKNTICKPLPGGSYCKKVDPKIIEQLDLIVNEPTIFQEEIPGDDVRVNMLDGQVISAHKIIKSNENILDYRTDPYYDSGQAQYEEVLLPEHVKQFCSKAMKRLGLRFSGIDLRKTNEDQYVLIECNSMPAFLDIELKTGVPITESIIYDLIEAPVKQLDNYRTSTIPLPKKWEKKIVNKSVQSLFDYYSVVKNWSEQAREQKKRIIVDLNEQQKEQMLHLTGSSKEKMELEIKQGQAKVLRVW